MVRLQPRTTVVLLSVLTALVIFFGYNYFTATTSTSSGLLGARVLGAAGGADGGAGAAANMAWAVADKRGDYNDVGVSIKNLKPGNDGNLELTLSLKLADIVRFLDSFSNGGRGQINPNDPTSNPVIPIIDIVMSPKDLCQNMPKLKWLFYVHTSPANVDRRKNIRNTWGNSKIYAEGTFAVVFIVGKSDDIKHQEILEQEQKTYSDIVQGDFHDAYRNLTLKTVVGLKWISSSCLNADYYVKADDDAFINVFEWMSMATQTTRANPRFIMCPMWQDNTMPILRDPEKCMKWCVKYSEFPGRSHFPGYCAGLALMMSREIVKEMYEAAQKTHFFWIDDVFLTGIVSRKLPNVYYRSLLGNFTLKANEAYKQYMSKDKLTIHLSHVKDYKMFNNMWMALLKRVGVNQQ